MVSTYTPAYYSSFHDTITSICKSILPFSFKNKRLPGQSSDHKLAKRQTNNLKWQQESFHRILNLIGLQKEGMVLDAEVSAFRTHMLDTLIASPAEAEPATVIRDKLLFLQELFYAKCVSAEQYHASKRPLLQRLAVQGVELDSRDFIAGNSEANAVEDEEWSVIDLRDRDEDSPLSKNKRLKQETSMKPIRSLLSMASRGRGKKEPFAPVDMNRNEDKPSVLMPETSSLPVKDDRVKKKGFRALFQKEQREEDSGEGKLPKSASKQQWGFEGLKKWKRSACEEDEKLATECPLLEGHSDGTSSVRCKLVASPIGEGPDTKRIKKRIHSDGSASDFFNDKVLGDNIKKELSRIKTELSATNPNINLSDDQIEAISTTLPADKKDLKKFFPKSWCDRYGDVVLDVVKKEFKDHVSEMEDQRIVVRERRNSSERWADFDENSENYHPNLFLRNLESLNERSKNNPFDDDDLNNPFMEHQNPFWRTANV